MQLPHIFSVHVILNKEVGRYWKLESLHPFSKVLNKNSTRLINLIKNKAAFEECFFLKGGRCSKLVLKVKPLTN